MKRVCIVLMLVSVLGPLSVVAETAKTEKDGKWTTADGNPIYNKPDAERAWSKLVALYKAALA